MDIVDAQIHLWAAHSPERPWPPGAEKLVQDVVPWTMERIVKSMDEAGVRRTVIVPPNWEGDRNDLALSAVAAHPDRFAVMGKVDLAKPPNPAQLASWKQQKGMLGLRFNLYGDTVKRFKTGEMDWIWEGAQRHGLPVALLCPDALDYVEATAARYPGVKIFIDHMATVLGGAKGDAAFVHLPDVLALAKYPNIAVKVSSLPCNAADPYPFPSLHPRIRAVYDHYGPERMFWGSDLSRLTCPYRQCVTLFTEELPFLSDGDKRLIMGEAICRWLDWPL